jgi:thymidylate kinase
MKEAAGSGRGRPLDNREREFLHALFLQFDEVSIPYVWMRNYEGYPESAGHDIDLAFRRSDLEKAFVILTGICARLAARVVHIHERDFVLALWISFQGASRALHLDFFPGGFAWHGLPFLADSTIYTQRRRFRDTWIARPSHEAACSFLSSILWGGFYKSAYRKKIAGLLSDGAENADFERSMETAFGKHWKPPFDMFSENPPPRKLVETYAASLRKSLRRRSFASNFVVSSARLCRHWLGEIRTVIRPPGIVVAVTGPDGAGKSTVLEGLANSVACFFGEVIKYHWRPGFLPDAGVLSGIRSPATGVRMVDPHGRPPQNGFSSLLRLLYYFVDHLVGYYPAVLKRAAKNHLVLFDRYMDDMSVDPRRFRLGLPPWLVAVVTRMCIPPNLIFVLHAPSGMIFERKQEVAPDMLAELLKRYSRLAGHRKQVYLIDAAKPAIEVIAECRNILLRTLEQRTTARRTISPDFTEPAR